MSRAASKNRADKGRGPTTPAPAPTPAVSQDVEDIIPGRLTQSFWSSMVAQEEGEEIVKNVLDDLMSQVMHKCKEVYLKQQLIPYTVFRARDTLVDLLEWRFLVQDPGEVPERTWEEDPEPQPLLIDSWAQGCVSVTHRKPAPPSQPQPTHLAQQRRRSQSSSTEDSPKRVPLKIGEEVRKSKEVKQKSELDSLSGPRSGSKIRPERNGLLPPISTSADPQGQSLRVSSLLVANSTAGPQQATSRPDYPSKSVVPCHMYPTVDRNKPNDFCLSPLKDHLRPNRSSSPPTLSV